MRIISKNQDYYDGVVQYSVEPIWIRKEIKTTTTKLGEYGVGKATIDKLIDAYRNVPTPVYTVKCKDPYAIVGFCGQLYAVYFKDMCLGGPQDIISADKPSSFVKKYNESCKYESDHIKTDNRSVPRYMDSVFWHMFGCFNDKGFIEWKNEHMFDVSDINRSIKSPIFMILPGKDGGEFIINPTLNNVRFQVIINPWDAYMELERFISNDMVDCPLDYFEMSDILKRDSKGMDEWSFKQRGPKPRKMGK